MIENENLMEQKCNLIQNGRTIIVVGNKKKKKKQHLFKK